MMEAKTHLSIHTAHAYYILLDVPEDAVAYGDVLADLAEEGWDIERVGRHLHSNGQGRITAPYDPTEVTQKEHQALLTNRVLEVYRSRGIEPDPANWAIGIWGSTDVFVALEYRTDHGSPSLPLSVYEVLEQWDVFDLYCDGVFRHWWVVRVPLPADKHPDDVGREVEEKVLVELNHHNLGTGLEVTQSFWPNRLGLPEEIQDRVYRILHDRCPGPEPCRRYRPRLS